jgi:hypothetical protein
MRKRKFSSYLPNVCGICNKRITFDNQRTYVTGESGSRDYFAHVDCIRKEESIAGNYKPLTHNTERE